jgi:hypothetical protein
LKPIGLLPFWGLLIMLSPFVIHAQSFEHGVIASTEKHTAMLEWVNWIKGVVEKNKAVPLFLGRSPSPVQAYFEGTGRPHLHLPLSSFRHRSDGPYSTKGVNWKSVTSFTRGLPGDHPYSLKGPIMDIGSSPLSTSEQDLLFDHFDRHIDLELIKEIGRVVVVDLWVSGAGMIAFLDYFEKYLERRGLSNVVITFAAVVSEDFMRSRPHKYKGELRKLSVFKGGAALASLLMDEQFDRSAKYEKADFRKPAVRNLSYPSFIDEFLSCKALFK